MKDLPKIAMYGILLTSYCDRGVQKKQYKDILKKSLNAHYSD